MLRFRLHMKFAPQACDEVISVLRSLVGPVRSEQGCIATRIQRDTTEQGNEIIWVEEWRSIEDFERHLRADVFRQILAVIEMAAEQPVIEIDDVSSRRGFELVEEILGLKGTAGAEKETGVR